jgi:hypothetical protein
MRITVSILALSDDDYRKCPICEDKIHKEDLKSVRIYPQVFRQIYGWIDREIYTRVDSTIS